MAELVSSWLGERREGWEGRCAWLQLVSYASCFLFCVAVCLAEAERNKWLIINEKSSVLLNYFLLCYFWKSFVERVCFIFLITPFPPAPVLSLSLSSIHLQPESTNSVPLPPSLLSFPAEIRLATAQASLSPVPSNSPHNAALAFPGRLFSVDAVPVDWHYFNLLLDLCLAEAKRLR